MRLGLVTVAIALVWALASGRGLDPHLPRVRWAPLGVVGLLGQFALGRVGLTGEVQVAGEVVSLAALLATCIVNPRLPGMVAVTAGVVANAIAIVGNAGMPVAASGVRAAGGSPAAVPLVGHHHLLNGSSNLPLLADTLGITWLDVVVSPGDALLMVGAVIVLSAALVGEVGEDPRRG